MKKYRLVIKDQGFTFEDISSLKSKVRELMDMGIWMIETKVISEEENPVDLEIKKAVGEKQKEKDKLLNKEQKIKPIEIDKASPEEMVNALKSMRKMTKKDFFPKKRITRKRFPKEMEGFVKSNLDLKYKDLAEKVNEKFMLDMDSKKMSDYLRYRNIKKKVIYSDDPRLKAKKSEGVKKARGTPKKYPDEMEDFVKENMESNSGKELVDLINEEYDVGITLPRLAAYMAYKKLKRERKANKYTDHVIEFLKENIDNFSNKEICKELEMRFDIKIKVANLSNFLSTKGIKREIKTDIDQEIVDFIEKSKITDVYVLRDVIIEKFEENLPIDEIKKLMKKNIPGEKVQDEVRRIEKQREDEDNESIDGMELD